MVAKVEGIIQVQQNLEQAIKIIGNNTADGIAAAGQVIKGDAQKLTPVDEGTLRLSAFSKFFRDRSNPVAVVGYTAKYAAAVHEAPMKLKGQKRESFGKTGGGQAFGGGSGKGNYWDGGENKFLEKAVVNNLSKIINIIAKFAGKAPV